VNSQGCELHFNVSLPKHFKRNIIATDRNCSQNTNQFYASDITVKDVGIFGRIDKKQKVFKTFLVFS
jgi:hypothetical protein